MTLFSVLEQAPVRVGATPAHAVRESLELARHVERLGFHRFWIAEHHALGAVASTAPEVLIGAVAGATRRLRVGSGGMLLPNHRPLHVAEQFRMLAALYPGRIDLGIGRSEGATDEAIVRAFGRPADSAHGAGYDAQLDQLLSFAGVVALHESDPLSGVHAGPQGEPFPPVFLLGSSADSARTAAARGLGYAFAAYSNPEVVTDALRLYRREFIPSAARDRPHAILGLKVVVGEDDAHARALALPWYLSWVRGRAGLSSELMTVEQAQAHRLNDAERAAEEKVRTDADVIGGPERVAQLLSERVAAAEADEVIVTTNAPTREDRWASYSRLAQALGLASPDGPRPSGEPLEKATLSGAGG
jgi:luciferase family oxidoreductase group 1